MAPRMLRIGGAVSQSVRTLSGMLAGCGFAVDLLETWMDPGVGSVFQRAPSAEVRIFVDDTNVS
eukprot:13825467-Alexandrium_andersonii.AAC.1